MGSEKLLTYAEKLVGCEQADDAHCDRFDRLCQGCPNRLTQEETVIRHLVLAVRAAYPEGSWCALCGQPVDNPAGTRCRDPERGCNAARNALALYKEWEAGTK